MRVRRACGVAAAMTMAACGGSARPAAAPDAAATARARVESERATAKQLSDAEELAFEAIAATDPRFARRLGDRPREDRQRGAAMKALVADDRDATLLDGALDIFSFTARARALDEAAKLIAHAPDSTSDAAPEGSAIPRPRLERELLVRVVEEERSRLEEERDLPRGASALVRGMVDTWSAPDSPRAMTARDAWLGARLDEVRATLASTALPNVALIELDDALDPLERLATPGEYPQASKALAGLRVALGNQPPGPPEADGASWSRVERGVRAHLGLTLAVPEIHARLERAERALRAEATALVKGGHLDDRPLSRSAEALVVAAGTCGATPADSRVRALDPPPERAAICGSVRALHDASDDLARAAAIIALHDEVVIALWSLAMHASRLAPARAQEQSPHPYFGVEPDREARWVRFAAARPVAALGAGLAAELLTRADATAASASWFTFGDAPLDVVERELFAGPSPTSSPAAASSSAPRPRASLQP